MTTFCIAFYESYLSTIVQKGGAKEDEELKFHRAERHRRHSMHYCRMVRSFVTGLNEIYLPMQLTDLLLVEVALLLIGPS
jgi:hypothetical protein